MSLAYNSQRGEIPLSVGGVDLVIAAEMKRMAELSTRLGCQSFLELYGKLAGVELAATLAAIEVLAVKGDTGKAVDAISLADLPACKDAFVASLLHHADKKEGNAATVKGAKKTQKSLGGDGTDSQS